MKKAFLTLLISTILLSNVVAQSQGDYRSVGSGDWNSNLSWQMFDNGSWVTPFEPPNANLGIITIQSGDTIDFATNYVDELVIHGTLRVADGQHINTLTPANSNFITIENGGILDLAGETNMQTTNVLRVKNGGTFIRREGSLLNGASPSTLLFEGGSTYEHLIPTNSQAIPLATWDAASTFVFSGYTGSLPPANFNQNYGNVSLVLPTGSVFILNGQLTSVRGNLTIDTRKAVWIATGSQFDLFVGGHLTLTNTGGGGSLLLNGSNGNTTVHIGGDLIWSSGVFSTTGPSSIIFDGPGVQHLQKGADRVFANIINFSVSYGSTLDLGESTIDGSGTLTLESGSTLRAGSTAPNGAIQPSSSAAGNIRVPMNVADGATIVYSGSSQQSLGSGHPSNAITIIDNAAGVKLAGSATINGDLILQNGNLDISQQAISLGGHLIPGNNELVADGNTTLSITANGASDDFNNLKFSGTTQIGKLSIDGARTVRLGADLTVSDELTLNLGNLDLNGFALDIQSTITQAGGSLTSTATSDLIVSSIPNGPLVSLPADLVVEGGAIGSITMNRLGATFTTSSDLEVTNLNLVAGTVSHTGNLTMAENGTVSVTSGELTDPLNAVSTYDVEYIGTEDISTGMELTPVNASSLRNLSNLNSSRVLLTSNATINGALTLGTDSELNTVNHNITLLGDLVCNGRLNFPDSSALGNLTFAGTTAISGTISPDLGDVTINGIVIISDLLQFGIKGDLAINNTFDTGESTLFLNGAENDQFITGTVALNAYGLEIDKSAFSVTLQNKVNIASVLRISTPTALNAGDEQLTLLSTQDLTARVNPLPSGAQVNGKVIVQRYLPVGTEGRYYRYLTPTVTNATVEDWRQETPITGTFQNPSTDPGMNTNAPSLYYYNESIAAGLNNRYVGYPAIGLAANAVLTNGRGYSLYVRSTDPITLDSHGTLAQGTIPISVTSRNEGPDDGWNLIGNPYASPVSWDLVTKPASLDNAFYIPDNSNRNGSGPRFITYINGASVPAVEFEGVIDAGQGFWVHANAAGTVTFNEADKVADTDTTGQFYREVNPQLLRMFMEGPSGNDEVAIRFKDEATDAFDSQYDALIFPHANLNFSTRSSDNRNLTINTLGSLDCNKVVPLTLNNLKAGVHTLRLTGVESIDTDVNLVLTDLESGASINLRGTGEYAFYVSEGTSELASRFVLEIDRTRVVTDIAVNAEAVCYETPNSLVEVEQTQPEVEYKVIWEGADLTDWKSGNGGNLALNIPVDNMPTGEHELTIVARNGCVSRVVNNHPTLVKYAKPVVQSVSSFSVCPGDAAILQASTTENNGTFNWYATADDTNALLANDEGSFTTENLTKTKTYFVAVANVIGCESERQKVVAEVLHVPDAEIIAANGNILVSNYEFGNQWYFNGKALAGETAQQIAAQTSGEYSIQVTVNGCMTSAWMEYVITSTDPWYNSILEVYPNPATHEIFVNLTSSTTPVRTIQVIDNKGQVADVIQITDSKGHLNIEHLSAGMYHLIIDGHTAQTFRIIKD